MCIPRRKLMDNITTKNKMLILVFGLTLGVVGTFGGFALSHQVAKPKATQNQQQKTTDKVSNPDDLTLDRALLKINDLKEQLHTKDKQIQSNDSNSLKDLRGTAQKFFEIYYNYDQEKVTNKDRQDKVNVLALPEVFTEMFPLSADDMTTDYGYIQSSLKTLDVYPTGLNGADVTALVDATYVVRAGDMASTVNHYLWKVTFDVDKKMIGQIEDMGKLGGN
jgi:hypothetical protein